MADDVIATVSGFESGTFEYSVASKAKLYLGEEPSALAVDFAIEKYKKARNYPLNYSDDKKSADLDNNIATIAMAVVDLENKVGVEGQTSDSDNGMSRQYENAYISQSIYSDVIPFVDVPR